MSIISFPKPLNRMDFIFINEPVLIRRMNDTVHFPCIGLYFRDTMEPVTYPCLERWYLPLSEAEEMAANTMKKRATVICAFMNYILHYTDCDALHNIKLKDISGFLVVHRTKADGSQRSHEGWMESVAFVYGFLCKYYIHNKNNFDFSYKYEDLITSHSVRANSSKRKYIIKQYNYLAVRPPKAHKKKNRMLPFGYLDFILLECEMYTPDITLGVALQAYAGLREGEIVNLSYNRIKLIEGGFGAISDVEIDLGSPALFIDKARKSSFGEIKIMRQQKVYPDFVKDIVKRIGVHMERMESLGYPVIGDNPVFVDKWGNPMSVHTYTNRIKKLFYEYFLPHLKKVSEAGGSWAADAPYIEAFENDYPGAHAFRHWFTMYLMQRTNLKPDEISKWRGDASRESVQDYIHLNAEMLAVFNNSAHMFQRSLLEEILADELL